MWIFSECYPKTRAPRRLGGVFRGGPECCNCLCLRVSKTAADIRHRSFQRARQMQCLLQTATTSFHPFHLKTRHMQVSGVNGSLLKRFVTTELREQWQLRIMNITGSYNVINCCVNSCQQSFKCQNKYASKHAVLWQACEMLDMMSYYNESAILHHPTDNNAVNTVVCFPCIQFTI